MEQNKWALPSEKILPQGEVLEKVKAMRIINSLSHCEEDLKNALDLLNEMKNNMQQEDFDKVENFLSKFR